MQTSITLISRSKMIQSYLIGALEASIQGGSNGRVDEVVGELE
jgi:hypothetical protein